MSGTDGNTPWFKELRPRLCNREKSVLLVEYMRSYAPCFSRELTNIYIESLVFLCPNPMKIALISLETRRTIVTKERLTVRSEKASAGSYTSCSRSLLTFSFRHRNPYRLIVTIETQRQASRPM